MKVQLVQHGLPPILRVGIGRRGASSKLFAQVNRVVLYFEVASRRHLESNQRISNWTPLDTYGDLHVRPARRAFSKRGH
jgi:hypothetical protein